VKTFWRSSLILMCNCGRQAFIADRANQ